MQMHGKWYQGKGKCYNYKGLAGISHVLTNG